MTVIARRQAKAAAAPPHSEGQRVLQFYVRCTFTIAAILAFAVSAAAGRPSQ
jgi:hypothetical protein